MTKLQAVLLSAEHWLENWKHPANASYDGDDCACCSYAAKSESPKERFCTTCPIYEFTGRSFCAGTPYDRAANNLEFYQERLDARNLKEKYGSKYYNTARAACEEEYRFIMNLALQLQPEQEDFDYEYDDSEN